jgi:hypothetical protein
MASDLGYIRNPDLWVQTLCPMVKRETNPKFGQRTETAYLFSREPVLRHGNIFAAKETDREERFESHEAILEAGWRVD